MTNVLISSTGWDLADHRRAAIEVCNRLEFVPKAMEYFPAMPQGPTEGSLLRFSDGDVYVGIFAGKYGTIDVAHDRSITELEYDFAGEQGIDRLCFLADPEHPLLPDAQEQAEDRRARLEAFKARIQASTICAWFVTVEDFAFELSHALFNWKQAHDAGSARETSLPDSPAPGAATHPPPPTLMLGREDDATRVKDLLFARTDEQRRRTTVIRGWPGVGKTTLVNALARDADVSSTFADGVLWASIGERPDPLGELIKWIGALTDEADAGAPTTVYQASTQVRELLLDRRALLILDDLWEPEAAAPYDVAGPDSATVVTTRFPEVARNIAATPGDVYVLGQLSDDAALELFQLLAPAVVDRYPKQALQLVHDFEGLPLALRVAARMLQAEADLPWAIDGLLGDIAGKTRILKERAPEDRYDPVAGELPTLSALLRKSTDRLDPLTRDRFAYLGAFAPKPATFDLEALQSAWEVEDARPTARTLADRGLLEPVIGTGRLQMHALLVKHAYSLLTD